MAGTAATTEVDVRAVETLVAGATLVVPVAVSVEAILVAGVDSVA